MARAWIGAALLAWSAMAATAHANTYQNFSISAVYWQMNGQDVPFAGSLSIDLDQMMIVSLLLPPIPTSLDGGVSIPKNGGSFSGGSVLGFAPIDFYLIPGMSGLFAGGTVSGGVPVFASQSSGCTDDPHLCDKIIVRYYGDLSPDVIVQTPVPATLPLFLSLAVMTCSAVGRAKSRLRRHARWSSAKRLARPDLLFALRPRRLRGATP